MRLEVFEVPCVSQASDEFGQRHTKSTGYFIDIAERHISLTSLDTSNVRTIQTAFFSKSLLRQSGLEPEFANALPESHEYVLSGRHFADRLGADG
jgi:hypothetical protein